MDLPLAAPIFLRARTPEGFVGVALENVPWLPGTELSLLGPSGKGFSLPDNASRVILASLNETVTRLLPLASHCLENGGAVTLFSDAPLPDLPSSIEAYPLSTLPESLTWGKFLAVDLPLEALSSLRQVLGLSPGARLPLFAQALITTSLPCGGLADCGACAVPARHGWKLACKDGPVFNLEEIDW